MNTDKQLNPNHPSADGLPKWTPFVKMFNPNTPPDSTLYKNSRYEVIIRKTEARVGTMTFQGVRLGIANVDFSARHDWREFQRIKNELLGPTWEAYEVYPVEDHHVDPSNFFLLWCFPTQVLDVGMNFRKIFLQPGPEHPQREPESDATQP